MRQGARLVEERQHPKKGSAQAAEEFGPGWYVFDGNGAARLRRYSSRRSWPVLRRVCMYVGHVEPYIAAESPISPA